MKLFNFDHGLSNPSVLEIGPYRINVSDAHCQNLAFLPRRSSKTFTLDDSFSRVVVDTSRSRGEFAETATVTCHAAAASLLFPDTPGTTQDYDLVLLLSFLTGRRVYVEGDLDWDPRRDYAGRVIAPEDLKRLPNDVWERLASMSQRGLSDSLNCIVNAALAPDLIGRGAYANAAFDTVCTVWAKEENKTKYDDRPILERASKRIVDQIDNALLNKAKSLILNVFPVEGVKNEIAQDIWARFRVAAAPSATLKMTWFLQAFGLFPSTPTPDQEMRLKRLNTVRNGIAHGGAIRTDKSLGPEVSLRVAGAVVLITQQIVEFYLAREVLGILSYDLEMHRKGIADFFESGLFRGQLVFSESYGEYLDRLEQQWVTNGVMGR
ncbi:hypothetical protein [Burkholderia cepacia]|uniref:hypothetical protein n=1 Tax=Burkholderia cepacia TaxID=292 RepID=UPI00201966A1|nr:hypothetical protein [Burkholderia cepacia]UQO32619.1 hypothetical protein L0Z22_08715 [Burkholderia cepacia]UQO46114.1 hypothetical protein L0Z05_10515 [Burkholderia cepacia]UQP11194.1 hypothetical protein L0Z01_24265 [Burkholderia cepacia]